MPGGTPGLSGRPRCWCGDPHPGALRQSILAVDDDLLARRQPLADDGDAVLHGTDLDVPALDRAVVLDHVCVMAVRSVLNGLRGDRGHPFTDVQDHPNIDELAGP